MLKVKAIPTNIYACSQKHQDNGKTLPHVKNTSSFMSQVGNSESDKTAVNEARFVHYIVRHDRSFCSNDCVSTLIQKVNEPKSAANTKLESI